MRLVRTVGLAVLVSGLGLAVPAYSQHGNHGEGKQGHEKHGDHGRPVRVEKHSSKQHVQTRTARRVVWTEHRATHWKNEHRGWQQRGGYHGYRVPHDRYVVYFGRAHRFRVHTYPVVIVSGRPRFHYHDCWITMVDPWPEYWAANWYETDDVYVEYVNDGYYMYNARHPGVAIAVSISL